MQTDIKRLACNSLALSLHDVFKLCQSMGVFRLVKTDEDNKYINIVICGVYRVRKNKQNDKVSMWRYTLKDKNSGNWHRINKLPVKVHLFWSKEAAFGMDEWLRYAIQHIIRSLLKAGYSIADNIWLFRVKDYSSNNSRFTSTLIPSSVSGYAYEALLHPLGKTTFNYPYDMQHISEHQLLEEIEKKIHHRAYKVIGVDNEFNASKALCKSIWQMVNKSEFSLYARASHNSMIYNSVRQSMFEDYLDFSKRIFIAENIDFGGLWPMIGRLRRQHKTGQFSLSGKTKELFDLLRFPPGFSYSDFKSLRHTRVSLVAALDNNSNDSFRYVSRLLRHPLTKCYPAKVIYWIVNYLECHFYDDRADDIYRVCIKWLEYHRDLFKNIGFRDHELRWETEKNYLCHAIDWLLDTEFVIHKNQEWPSFWRLSEEWTQRLRRNSRPVITEWKGTGINWQAIDDGVSELITFYDLCNEGNEMEHCVASYAHSCASGKYLAISVSLESERATLGLSRTEHDVTYRFDQMRGFRNQAVSRSMMSKGRHILKVINTSLTN